MLVQINDKIFYAPSPPLHCCGKAPLFSGAVHCLTNDLTITSLTPCNAKYIYPHPQQSPVIPRRIHHEDTLREERKLMVFENMVLR